MPAELFHSSLGSLHEFSRWLGLRKLVTAFHVQVARFDCETVGETDPASEGDYEVSPQELCIEVVPNDAQFHVHFMQQVGSTNWLQGLDSHFDFVCGKLVEWLVAQDQQVSTKRLVSFVDFFVVFRRDLGALVSGVDVFNRYVVPTFAAEFKLFRKALTHLFSTVGFEGWSTSGHLTVLGIHVPQTCMEMGFTHDSSVEVQRILPTFVGARPITCAQGFSKPFLFSVQTIGSTQPAQSRPVATTEGRARYTRDIISYHQLYIYIHFYTMIQCSWLFSWGEEDH